MPESDTGAPARVLVVDDENAIRYSFKKTLQRVGYQVDAAASAEEALVFLEETEYDVVLTDIRMPGGISGVELLMIIREKYSDTSVILVTGYASLGTAVEGLRLGAHDYLVKPSSSHDIRESVSKGVERAHNMRHRRNLLAIIQNGVKQLTGDNTLEPLPQSQPSVNNANAGEDKEPLRNSVIEEMSIGSLTLYPGRYQIGVGNELIDLTPTEFDLLLYLAAHRGRIVPCGELVREVRGYALDEAEAREVIRPHVSNMRRKIKLANPDIDLIVNIRGIGYRLTDIE